jgi:hypothetical protein
MKLANLKKRFGKSDSSALRKRTKKIIQACSEAICPDLPEISIREEDNNFSVQLECFLLQVSKQFRKIYIVDFLFFNFSPLIFFYSYRTFVKLGLHQKREYCEKTLKSRLAFRRNSFRRIKTLIQIHFFDRGDVCNYLGYPIDKFIKSKIRERRKLLGKDYIKLEYE